jgi:hypothetical protein
MLVPKLQFGNPFLIKLLLVMHTTQELLTAGSSESSIGYRRVIVAAISSPLIVIPIEPMLSMTFAIGLRNIRMLISVIKGQLKIVIIIVVMSSRLMLELSILTRKVGQN